MAMSEKQKEYDKIYQSRTKQYRCKYTLADLWIADIIDSYLSDNNMSMNELIHRMIIDKFLDENLLTLEELEKHGMNYPKEYTCKRNKLKDVM